MSWLDNDTRNDDWPHTRGGVVLAYLIGGIGAGALMYGSWALAATIAG